MSRSGLTLAGRGADRLKSSFWPADSSSRVIEASRAPALRDESLGTMTMILERKTVSIPRACELVGVSRRTIYNWIAGGKVQYVRTAGGSVRIYVDTLWREPDAANTDAAWTERLSRGA